MRPDLGLSAATSDSGNLLSMNIETATQKDPSLRDATSDIAHVCSAPAVEADDDKSRPTTGLLTAQLLVDALRASPHRNTKMKPRRAPMPVRAVKL